MVFVSFSSWAILANAVSRERLLRVSDLRAVRVLK